MAEEFATKERDSAFQSLSELKRRWKEGTFGEIVDDWKWIFTYSVRYKKAIAFYIVLGIISTSLGLVSSVIGKYLINHSFMMPGLICVITSTIVAYLI